MGNIKQSLQCEWWTWWRPPNLWLAKAERVPRQHCGPNRNKQWNFFDADFDRAERRRWYNGNSHAMILHLHCLIVTNAAAIQYPTSGTLQISRLCISASSSFTAWFVPVQMLNVHSVREPLCRRRRQQNWYEQFFYTYTQSALTTTADLWVIWDLVSWPTSAYNV